MTEKHDLRQMIRCVPGGPWDQSTGWRARFECEECGRRQIFTMNYLHNRLPYCDGVRTVCLADLPDPLKEIMDKLIKEKSDNETENVAI